MTIYQELMFAATHPMCVIGGFVLLGRVFRVDVGTIHVTGGAA